MYLSERTKTAEEKLDACLKRLVVSAGGTTSEAEETADALKGWVKALIEEEKSDLRDEINKSGQWDPDY